MVNINLELDQSKIKDLVTEISQKDEILLTDMPPKSIDLYMEQLLSFINDKLQHESRDGSKLLTKTMVNNYTKDGLLNPPNNKKYNQEHMILLILVYHLKQILSIKDIKLLFAPILQNLDKSEVGDDIISLQDIYSAFIELKNDELKEFVEHFNNKLNIIKGKTSKIENAQNQDLAELFLTVIMLIAQADVAKAMAERIIDHYFKALQSV